DVCKLLLTHGATQEPCRRGWTPLAWATLTGCREVCELLLSHLGLGLTPGIVFPRPRHGRGVSLLWRA
ncbi:MAG: hypothetical protein Q8S55_18440, partial [Methylococcaceae bacterium]|nr:hypothetical protein [Methylococcaceae bacterium]